MSKILYRNYNTKVIRELLKEIGEYRYNQALENMKIGNSKPTSMEGFYLEATEYYLKICYMYPSRFVLKLMDVDRFNHIPVKGWERIKETV